jgi:hypothetical protein
MTEGLIGRLLGEEEISAKTAPEPFGQLRDPTLDERVSVYLRAINGKRDFGHAEYSDARDGILNAMAADVAVKLGNDLPDISGMPIDREYGATGAKTDVYPVARAVSPGVYLSASRPRLLAAASREYAEADERDYAIAALEITPPRRPQVKFSVRTIGALSIMVCAAALIAGAGTLFFRNEDSSLAWFALPQQAAKTEVPIQSSASKAGPPMPATIQQRMATSESPGQQPSPEEVAELIKRGRASLTAETASRGPSIEVRAAASMSPFQQVSPEELSQLVKRGNGIGAGTASLLPSLAASQAVASGSPTLAAALAWYQSSR